MNKNTRIFYIDGNLKDKNNLLNKIISFYSKYKLIKIDSIELCELSNLICSYSCFDENKIFILKDIKYDIAKTTAINHLKKMINKVPQEYVIIFDNIDLDGLKKIISGLEDGKVFEFSDKLTENEAVKYILEFFKEKEKVIDNENAQLVFNLNANKEINVNKLLIILNKCISYLGRFKEIKREDIIKLFSYNSSSTIWTVFNDLDKKNFDNAYADFNFILNESNDKKSFTISTLYLFSWRYKGLFLIKEELSKGLNLDLIKQFIKISTKGLRDSIVCNSDGKQVWADFFINSARNVCSNYSRRDLKRIVETINWGLIEIRKGKFHYKFIADVLLLTCCNKLDDIQLGKVLK